MKKLFLGNHVEDQNTLIMLCFLTDRANSVHSRHLSIPSTGTRPIETYLSSAIEAGRVEYRPENVETAMKSAPEQAALFRRDWENTPHEKLVATFNPRLRGCFLDTAINGRTYIPAEQRLRAKKPLSWEEVAKKGEDEDVL